MSKLKLFSSIGLSLLCASSAPLVWVNSGKLISIADNSIFEKLKNSISGLDIFQIPEKLKNEYNNNKNQAEKISEKIKNLKENYEKAKEASKQAYNNSKPENLKAINYWSWKLNTWIQSLVRWIPEIVKDSFLEIEGKEKSLLSIQKIYNTISSAEFSNFTNSIASLWTKHSQNLEKISEQDRDEFINAFKSIPNEVESIKNHLKKIVSHEKELESSYSCASKLIYDLIVGKNFLQNLITKLSELQKLLEAQNGQQNEINQIKTKISPLETQVKNLKKIKECEEQSKK